MYLLFHHRQVVVHCWDPLDSFQSYHHSLSNPDSIIVDILNVSMVLSSYLGEEPTDRQIVVSNLNRNCAFYMIILKMHKNRFISVFLSFMRNMLIKPLKIVNKSLRKVPGIVDMPVGGFCSLSFRTLGELLTFKELFLVFILIVKVKDFQ